MACLRGVRGCCFASLARMTVMCIQACTVTHGEECTKTVDTVMTVSVLSQ